MTLDGFLCLPYQVVKHGPSLRGDDDVDVPKMRSRLSSVKGLSHFPSLSHLQEVEHGTPHFLQEQEPWHGILAWQRQRILDRWGTSTLICHNKNRWSAINLACNGIGKGDSMLRWIRYVLTNLSDLLIDPGTLGTCLGLSHVD